MTEQREKAWKITSFPCVGRWKFLNLIHASDSRYLQILFRLKLRNSRDALLDLGCCLGQALRQFRAAGVDGSRLFGIDIDHRLIDIGYEMFHDRKSLGAAFIIGDLVDPNDPRPAQLKGKITIVHADSFFHLFNWTQQLYIGIRIVSFLKPGTKNAVVYGRHAGTRNAESSSTTHSDSPYLHNEHSFQRLWDEIGKMTSTKWLVKCEVDGSIETHHPGFHKDAVPMNFTVLQIP